MLWETVDAGRALRDRFGFASEREAADWAVATVRTRWGVRATGCSRIVMSDRNALAWLDTDDDDSVLLKWCVEPSRFRRLAVAADVAAWLGARGLPVSAPVPAIDGSVQLEVDGVSAGLQRVVVGDLLDVAVPGEVRATGAALARVHHALAAYPRAADIAALRPAPLPLVDQVAGWLGHVPEHLPSAATDLLRDLLAAAPTESMSLQVVHGDVRSANVLLADGVVVGMLDLEELRTDHRVVELARAAVMLGTRYRDWGPTPEAARQTFLDGYTSVSPLTPTEAAWWDLVVLWTSLALVPSGDDPTGWRAAADEQVARLRDRATSWSADRTV